MRRIYYLCSICFVTYSTLAYADISFLHDALLITNTESTLAVESPFSQQNQIKLAAVYPIASSSGISFKTPKSVSCSAGYTNINGKCVKKCDRKIYPLSSVPSTTKGVYTSCTGAGTFYGYTSCNAGWTLEGHDCVSSKCSGYPFSERPSDALGTVTSCKSGETTFYKYSSCNSGWNLGDGRCIAQSCSSSDYPYTSDPGSSAGTVITCKSGATTFYGYSSCNAGWSKSGGYCNINTCDTNVYPYTSRAQAAGCQTISECKSGTNNYFSCGTSGCKDGYTKSDLMCNACTWKGYVLTSCPAHGSCNNDVCGNITKYSLTGCDANYYRDGDTCPACTWNGYTLASCPENGTCSQDTCGGTTKYGLTACNTSYYQSGNTCLACTWNGYTLTECPANGTCANNTCGNITKYSLSSCAANYYVNGSSCTACTWNGYTLTSCPDHGTCANNTCGGTTKYSLSSCNNGYYQSGNSCVGCTWNGYTLTECPANGSCANNTCGNITKYSLSSCAANYYVNGNSCTACTWNGYTLTSCPDHGTCASDTCGGTTKYALTGCQTGYTLNWANSCVPAGCQVGWIYYADDSCSANLLSGKTAIGVVVDSTRKLAMQLNYQIKCWTHSRAGDSTVPSLNSYASFASAVTDYNGQYNSRVIDAYASTYGIQHQAASYCVNLTTGGKYWYLPAMGELQLVLNNLTAIKNGVTNANGNISLFNKYLWSSTQYNFTAWDLCPDNGDARNHYKDVQTGVVCFFKYNI